MPSDLDESKAEAFSGRIFNAAIESLDLISVYLGDRLGLYKALAEGGPATASELAERASIHPRYAREWLEQQAVTAFVDVDDVALPENERTYTLPQEHAAAVVDPDSPFSVAPLARAVVSVTSALPQLLEAYRTGGGVPWEDYGADGIESQGDFNRPWLVHQFGTEYLPSIPDLHARLLANPPARVADIACGVGWASIAIAKAYPNVIVEGFDLDQSSIEIARTYAREHGLADRVRFEVHDVAARSNQEPYDLVVMVEALHDLSQPVPALVAMRESLAPDGVVIIADERVADAFTAPGDEVERLFYGISTVLCLPAAMTEEPTAATGTVMRASTMRVYALEAGFKDVEVLDLDHPMLRFYRLSQ